MYIWINSLPILSPLWGWEKRHRGLKGFARGLQVVAVWFQVCACFRSFPFPVFRIPSCSLVASVFSIYYGLKVGVLSKFVEILTPNVMGLGGEAFGRPLGHQGGAPRMGFVPL